VVSESISTSLTSEQFALITTFSLIMQFGPIKTFAPICTFLLTDAVSEITAESWIKGITNSDSSLNNFVSFAYVKYGSSDFR
jgi:hypothetical protein